MSGYRVGANNFYFPVVVSVSFLYMFYKKHYKVQEFCYLGVFYFLQVHAVDMDKGENGEVRYELIKGHGELFKVCRKTGEVTLKQNLEGHNREYELIIAAYDGGRIMH
jgi:Cadherin domain.